MKIASRQASSIRSAGAVKSLSTLALAVAGLSCVSSPASATPILGSNLATFAVLAATGVTSGGTGSTIGGNLGSYETPAVTGVYNYTSGTTNPGTENLAQDELTVAILAVNAFVPSPANTIAAGNLNLQLFQDAQTDGVIAPGTYSVASATSNFDSTIILDGGGNNAAQWYFQFTGTLITGTDSNVLVQNVGDGANVGIYWTVADAATLNGPTFAGNVLANNLISSDGNLTIACGRLLSADAQVTLIEDSISITGCANDSGGYDQGADIGSGGQTVPEPGTLALLGFGLAGLAFARRRHG